MKNTLSAGKFYKTQNFWVCECAVLFVFWWVFSFLYLCAPWHSQPPSLYLTFLHVWRNVNHSWESCTWFQVIDGVEVIYYWCLRSKQWDKDLLSLSIEGLAVFHFVHPVSQHSLSCSLCLSPLLLLSPSSAVQDLAIKLICREVFHLRYLLIQLHKCHPIKPAWNSNILIGGFFVLLCIWLEA